MPISAANIEPAKRYAPVEADMPRSYFDEPAFVAFCVEVRDQIGKKPLTTAAIKRKVGNDRWLQDALDALIGAGEVERIQLGAMSGYKRTSTVRQIEQPNWNGRKKQNEKVNS